MFEYIERLTATESENLKQAIKALFRQTCVLQVKYDPVTLVPRDDPRYDVLSVHRRFVQDYLEVMGCELNHDPQEHLYWLSGEGAAAERLSETTSLLILLLKMIYRDKIMGAGLMATVTNLAEIREYGKNTNLINRKLNAGEWREALSVMRTHQIIELPGAIGNMEDHTPVYIYGTINIYCAATDINELLSKYIGEAKEEQEIRTEERNTDEAGEESIYPDIAE